MYDDLESSTSMLLNVSHETIVQFSGMRHPPPFVAVMENHLLQLMMWQCTCCAPLAWHDLSSAVKEIQYIAEVCKHNKQELLLFILQ